MLKNALVDYKEVLKNATFAMPEDLASYNQNKKDYPQLIVFAAIHVGSNFNPDIVKHNIHVLNRLPVRFFLNGDGQPKATWAELEREGMVIWGGRE